MYASNQLGFHDLSGNVWEWMEDHFNGLPGFKTHAFYDDFSSPTFDGKHNVILGGSWASTGDLASKFARYAFRRHFFQHCGFRLARSCTNDDNNEAVQLPVRLIDKPVYVLHRGVNSMLSFKTVSHTNTRIHEPSMNAPNVTYEHVVSPFQAFLLLWTSHDSSLTAFRRRTDNTRTKMKTL